MSENEELSGGASGAWGEEPHAEHDPVAEAFGRSHGKKRKRKKHAGGNEIAHLNLTPMMDIMTILLVFLIQSFGMDPQNINVSLTLKPPQSSADVLLEPATKVTITSEMILVDDLEISAVADLKLEKGKQMEIAPVGDALRVAADKIKAIENRGGAPFDGRLLIVAHDTTPYHVIMSVLFTAGQAQFSEYKLVVMKK